MHDALGYHNVEVQRCCAKCAFYNALPFKFYGSPNYGRCMYINTRIASGIVSGDSAASVDEYALCTHFVSCKQMKAFRECESADEMQLVLDIMCSEHLDDLLVEELQDGISRKRKATIKMMSFADKIEQTLCNESCSGKVIMPRPLAIHMCNVAENGHVRYVDKSDNFERVYEYINANEQFVRRRSKIWSEVML